MEVEMNKPTVIALVNQKGGTGKTQSTENLGIGLASEGTACRYGPAGLPYHKPWVSKSR